jgi:SAM-dependent methyltransferase
MRLAIVTPTNNSKYLGELYASLQNQTDPDWEWRLFHDPCVRRPQFDDPRVIVEKMPRSSAIGQIKKHCFSAAAGAGAEILVEVDHDDLLREDAVERIKAAFADLDTGFVYSDYAEFDDETKLPSTTYNADHGWTYRDDEALGRAVKVPSQFELTPSMLSRIWYAPNHVRAWRASVYLQLGSHNAELPICDDQDLVCRSYLATQFERIPECLYLYRNHAGQAFRKFNMQIQEKTIELHDRYIQALAERWCDLQGLLKVDLCCGNRPAAGYIGVDRAAPAEVVADLDGPWPFEDGSVGLIRAQDALEHLKDPVHTMNEAWRCLAHGGMLLSETPSTDGRGAFQDPTHVSFWNANSFWYYTRAEQAQFNPAIACRFIDVRRVDYYPSPWHEQHRIAYIRAHLAAVKDGPRLPGLLEI